MTHEKGLKVLKQSNQWESTFRRQRDDGDKSSGHDWPWLITFPIRTLLSHRLSSKVLISQWSAVGWKNPLRMRGITPRSQSKSRSHSGGCQLEHIQILIFRFPAHRMAPPLTVPCCPSKTVPPLLETLSSTGPSRKYQTRLIKIFRGVIRNHEDKESWAQFSELSFGRGF